MDLKKPENILELIKCQKKLVRQYWHYMNQLVKTRYKNAALLTYWLRDYLRYLKAENAFNPKYNITDKPGQIVYVNFGYRIGSELGGCHYAIVLDVKNSKSNSQVTVIPMKSKRTKDTAYSKIYHVNLSAEIQRLLVNKAADMLNELSAKTNAMVSEYGLEGIKNNPILQKEISIMQRQLLQAKDTIDFAQNKLNHESVADVGQICTISKIRIVHPVKKTDVLTNICLSPESMYKIEEKLHHLFFTGNS